ncbi:CMP-N-acetylneuraminate-poly-alpha-2,8-sialyltransferase-like [Branchiostoma floridae]|uniref:CMP-N-acetylneuraminate-poly-alpha-2, 8-sialyltransferase-like n=1 Tax=Branchiostoma floridae TaxID=7739 RepID=A0A9J7MLY0_BRAFL|nr:CMP-N-acetylneuraminate-poly-alpha-2,8-sialyltransferase-like [Branchiostoma floridae]
MRFRIYNVAVSLLLVACTGTIMLVGRKPVWLIDVSDSPNSRVERSLEGNTGGDCHVADLGAILPGVFKKEKTLEDTEAEIIRPVHTISKEHLYNTSEDGSYRETTAHDRTGRDLHQDDSPENNCSVKLRPRKLGIVGTAAGSTVVRINRSKDLVEVMRAFKGTWKENKELSKQIRDELAGCCDVESSVMTKRNVKVGDQLPNVLNRKLPLKITRDIYRVLPKESPFRNKHYQKCAVVGNSGILRGSRCGTSIDSADAVFRCNLPPLQKQIYKNDAGVKSTYTTAPISMLKLYMQMKDNSVREKFLKDMASYRGILSLKKPNNYTNYMISAIEGAMKGKLSGVYEHPHHFMCIDNYWRNRGIPRKITSGIYIISMALTLCDEVHVYGFWPFSRDDKGRKVFYHYYKAPVFVKNAHNMPLEFFSIRQMHLDGVIKVHMQCSRNIGPRSTGKKKARPRPGGAAKNTSNNVGYMMKSFGANAKKP